MRTKHVRLICLWLLAASIFAGGCASTMTAGTAPVKSSYPEKPITMIVPFSVGGGGDLTARELEKTFARHFGQPLTIVNRPGSAGAIGWNELASSQTDGYTLGIVSSDAMLNPLYGQTKYHYPTALEPILQVSSSPLVLTVSTNSPWETLEQLIKYGQSYPGKLKFSHGGIGSLPHVIFEMFSKETRSHLEQVPFRGGGETVAAVLGGHVQIAATGISSVREHIKAGKLRALAISSDTRITDPVFRDVPTFKEQGVDIICNYWYSVGAPKGLPLDIKEKLSKGFREIVDTPEFRRSQEALGNQLDYLDAQATTKKWLEENGKFAKVVQETGIADLIKAQKK